MRYTCLFLLVILWFTKPAIAEQPTASSDNTTVLKSIQTAEEALDQAYRYTGFKEILQVSQATAAQMATVSVLSDKDKATLGVLEQDKPVWTVRLKGMSLDYSNYADYVIQEFGLDEKDIDLFIDSASGHLIGAFCVSATSANQPDSVSLDSWKDRLKHGKVYHGTSIGPPTVTLSEAISKFVGQTDPLRSKLLIITCAHFDRHGDGPKAVWAVTSLGAPNVMKGERIFLGDERTTIINAETGEWMSISNRPLQWSIEQR